MSDRITRLLASLRDLENEIERELADDLDRGAAACRYRIQKGAVTFEEASRQTHRTLRKTVVAFLRDASLASVVSAPLVYAMIVPIALLDLALTGYQAACFRAYGIPRVVRSRYVAFDRRHLGYLNWIEKLNCEYCSYANGVLAYVREIAARTEQYWCPIKHARRMLGSHRHYRDFIADGDAEGWRRELPVLREALRRS